MSLAILQAMLAALRVVLIVGVLLGLPAAPAARGAEGGSTGAAVVSDELPAPPDLASPDEHPSIARRAVGELNGRFLLLNMHGALFHTELDNVYEDLEYARWLNAGIIRVFATDAGGFVEWSGERVGERIAELAPALRSHDLKLIVALVNNHRQVPGERPESYGWMDGYHQLLLPFYQGNWREAYLPYIRGLIGTVVRRGAQDVVWAWELGNELHTPQQPRLVMSFINAAAAEVRQLDPGARILAGTMGANHLEPGVADSAIARALYCHGPISAYTLHTYDWRTPDYWGDMPIHWDFEHVVNRACPNGRELPIVVEELGTSRELIGVYDADQEDIRLEQELNQIRMVLSYPGVIGIGAWSAESPYVKDHSRFDKRRGLTSYGSDNLGGGSCYRIPDDQAVGARCLLERALRALPAVP